MHKIIKTKEMSERPNLIPFGISFNGSIANSIARILCAICRLIEVGVDWLIWKIKKSMRE